MVPMLVVLVPRKVVQKLSSHCSSAVAFGNVPKLKGFADRYFYNSKFVNSRLLNSNYIQKLKSLCRFVKPNVSYSEVVKKCQSRAMSDQSS